MVLFWIIVIILAVVLILPLVAHRLFWGNIGKFEFVTLKEDHVCENPYCDTEIKAGEPAVKKTHVWSRKDPEWYHDMLCAKKSPNITRRG